MPDIRCFYIDCMFLEDGYCTSSGIKLEPDDGCMTYTRVDDLSFEDEDWDDEDIDEVWEDSEDEELYLEDEEDEWEDDF
jgi:hypothetical protein